MTFFSQFIISTKIVVNFNEVYVNFSIYIMQITPPTNMYVSKSYFGTGSIGTFTSRKTGTCL
jgi:hypothetical protein